MAPIVTGSSDDILRRVKVVIPFRWFAYSAVLRDAVLGGLCDLAAWCYSWITFARQQSRLATATGVFLDIFALDFLGRYLMRNGSNDVAFRARIRATILQERVTRAGMVSAVTVVTGNAPIIFEPWNTGDAGAYGIGTLAYGSSGGWGNMGLPAQVFMVVTRGTTSGVPNTVGFGHSIPSGDDAEGGFSVGDTPIDIMSEAAGGPAGFGAGSIQYIGDEVAQIGITDNNIYATITATKPTGAICWVRIQ